MDPGAITSVDTIVLCGGLGTRLRSAAPDRPKGLAEIGGRPFLDILISHLLAQGLHRFILCTGYGSDQIVSRYGPRMDAEFVFSVEQRPLGTGGAITKALPSIRSDPFVVLNGDSLCAVNYRDLLAYHNSQGALLTIVGSAPDERSDVGAILADANGAVLDFSEKRGRVEASRYVNAGIYVMARSIIVDANLQAPFSLEQDLVPFVTGLRRCFVYAANGPVIDIGTPERFAAAQTLLR